MKKKKLLVMALVSFFTVLTLFSGCRHHSRSHKAEFMVDYITETLDLNQSQETELNRIKDEIMEKSRQLHANRETMFNEMVIQLRSEVIDQDRVRVMIADHRAQMDELIDFALPLLVEFHSTLTPDQREKLISKLEKFKDRHHRSWE